MSKDILTEVSKKIEQGYGKDFLKLIEKIDKQKEEATLPSGLKEILGKIGNTPIAEPELFELSKQIANQEKSIVDLVLKYLSEEDMDAYSIDNISYFAGMAIRQVTSKKDENGIFKQTEATKDWERPKPSHIKAFEAKIRESLKIDSKNTKETTKWSEEYEAFLLKASKMQDKVLSEWEKQLVMEQTSGALNGYVNSFLGKR